MKRNVILVLSDCKRTSADQKLAIKKYVEAVINRGSHTSAQLKQLGFPSNYNDMKKPFTIKVNDVKTKDCLIYVTGVLTGKELNREMIGNQFLNRFKPKANLNVIRPVPESISHIKFGSMGLKMETGLFQFMSWNWPANAK